MKVGMTLFNYLIYDGIFGQSDHFYGFTYFDENILKKVPLTDKEILIIKYE